MTGTWIRAAAGTIVVLALPLFARAQAGPDAELAKGIDQVQNGALDDAVDTLAIYVNRNSVNFDAFLSNVDIERTVP